MTDYFHQNLQWSSQETGMVGNWEISDCQVFLSLTHKLIVTHFNFQLTPRHSKILPQHTLTHLSPPQLILPPSFQLTIHQLWPTLSLLLISFLFPSSLSTSLTQLLFINSFSPIFSLSPSLFPSLFPSPSLLPPSPHHLQWLLFIYYIPLFLHLPPSITQSLLTHSLPSFPLLIIYSIIINSLIFSHSFPLSFLLPCPLPPSLVTSYQLIHSSPLTCSLLLTPSFINPSSIT